MKINKLKKVEYIISILLIIIMFLGTISVYANQKTDLTNEQKDIDKQIQETSSEIAGVKSQMTDALNQINNYNSQIGTYEDEISTLETQVSSLQSQITEKEVNIQNQEKKYQEQQELLNKRLVAMYESGTTSYLDMLLSSSSLSDFISKYYVIEQLTEYDNELLNGIENTKKQIETEKIALENAKNEVQSSKTQAENKRNSLSVLVNEKNTLVGNLSAEEKELQQKLEEFEQDKKDIQRQLAEIARQEEEERRKAAEEAAKKAGKPVSDADTSFTPNTSGFICPLSGKSKRNITTGMNGYRGHTGVDFACPQGTPILAAKDGKVVISTALRNSSGGYRSYGEYISISHGDGTMTLYAHMSRRAVEKNAQVKQGQVIGYVGSTGNSTGNHLHFEIFVSGRRVNPAQYLP